MNDNNPGDVRVSEANPRDPAPMTAGSEHASVLQSLENKLEKLEKTIDLHADRLANAGEPSATAVADPDRQPRFAGLLEEAFQDVDAAMAGLTKIVDECDSVLFTVVKGRIASISQKTAALQMAHGTAPRLN